MKFNFNPLKALLLLFVCFMCGSCKDEEPAIKEDPEEVRQGIEEFFTAYLSGTKTIYEEESAIKISDIAHQREIIWEAWRKANNNFSEEKLIPAAELSQRNSGLWNIPEDYWEPIPELPYYWGYKGNMPQEGFPMFCYLHGSGNKDAEWSNGMKLSLQFDDAPSMYFIPQNPNTGDYQPWFLKGKQYAFEKLLRLALVSGEVDPDRMYLIGISEGGYGSQRLGAFYADYLAGAGPMAGGEPIRNAPVENYRNTAFSLRTGANDTGFERNTLTRYTKEEFEKFRSQYPESFTHDIQLIPGAGHSIDYTQTTPWLKEFKRNPYPKFVSWENFDMHGRYRTGFYNIYVNERSDDDSARAYYELQINGNDISLKAELVTYETTEVDPTWGMAIKFAKTYQPVTKGKVTIYLCPELVDLNQEITLNVNGRQAFKGKVKPDRKHMVNSCAAFFDPARIYPAAIEVEL